MKLFFSIFYYYLLNTCIIAAANASNFSKLLETHKHKKSSLNAKMQWPKNENQILNKNN